MKTLKVKIFKAIIGVGMIASSLSPVSANGMFGGRGAGLFGLSEGLAVGGRMSYLVVGAGTASGAVMRWMRGQPELRRSLAVGGAVLGVAASAYATSLVEEESRPSLTTQPQSQLLSPLTPMHFSVNFPERGVFPTTVWGHHLSILENNEENPTVEQASSADLSGDPSGNPSADTSQVQTSPHFIPTQAQDHVTEDAFVEGVAVEARGEQQADTLDSPLAETQAQDHVTENAFVEGVAVEARGEQQADTLDSPLAETQRGFLERGDFLTAAGTRSVAAWEEREGSSVFGERESSSSVSSEEDDFIMVRQSKFIVVNHPK